jgi:hypothetical protein
MLPDRDDPIFDGFDPMAAFRSQLRTVTRANLVIGPSSLQESVTAGQSALNALNIGRTIAGRVSIDFGVPSWVEDALRTFFDLAAVVGVGTELLKAAGKLARDLSMAYAQSIAAIPIIGIVVDIAIAIGQLVARIVEYTDKDPPPGEPYVYDRDTDELNVEFALEQMNRGDWTKIFRPPRTDLGWEHEEIAWTPGLTGKGHRFVSVGHDSMEAFGCVPGIADVFGIYQYPTEMPPGLMGGGAIVNGMFGAQSGGRGSPLTPMLTSGSISPSLAQLGVTAWQTAMRPSVSTFLIRASQLRDEWAGYFQSLGSFRSKLDPGQLSMQAERAMWASTVTWNYSSKKTEVDKKRNKLGLDLAKIVDAPAPFGMYDTVTSLVRQLERRQRYALGTLVCAYVPPDAPALLGDQVLADLHDERRRQLLEHAARFEVEKDLIPDAAYRSAMSAATMKVGGGFTSGPSGPTRTAPKGKAPALDPDGAAEPPSDQGNPWAGSTGGGGGGALAIAAALAIAGVAWARSR